jgi:hypothetical protein
VQAGMLGPVFKYLQVREEMLHGVFTDPEHARGRHLTHKCVVHHLSAELYIEF